MSETPPKGFDALEWGMTFAGPLSFARVPARAEPLDAEIAVVGVPFDLGTTNRSGARLGPRAVREESSLAGEFPEGLWPWDHDVRERFRVVDLGDIGFSIPSVDSMLSQVTARVSALAAAGISVLGLGGDHLVAYPLLRAQAEHRGPLSLVHLDAHADTWPDDGNLHHGSMFRRAADEGLVDSSRSVQIGMRTPCDAHGFNVVHADELLADGIDPVVARCQEVVGDRPVYLSVDIDFLDPAYAPGTGTPVVGGPTTWDARRLLLGLAGLDIVAADLVEVAPAYDHGGITALAGATLALDELQLLGVARTARADQAATGDRRP
jgi:agmatinase